MNWELFAIASLAFVSVGQAVAISLVLERVRNHEERGKEEARMNRDTCSAALTASVKNAELIVNLAKQHQSLLNLLTKKSA